MLSLTHQQMTGLIDAARADLVAEMIRDNGASIHLLSPAQAAGILDIRPNTLTRLPIPRVALDTKLIKYRLSDITAFIESRVER
jgi:hypothetical protein